MSTPTLVKTWQISKNNKVRKQSNTSLDTSRLLMRTIKNIMIGFGSSPWTVRGSSNGTGTGSLDGVDRWAADSNLVWAAAASNHSWIVLRQTGIATNFELCIDLSSSSDASATIVVSPSAAFTGGSATARPTATDEIVLVNNTTWGTGGADNHVVQGWQSTDGQCTRIAVFRAGVCILFMLFDKPQNPVSGWTNPSVSMWLGSSTAERCTYAILSSSTEPARGRGSTTMNISLTFEGYAGGLLGSTLATPNDLTDEWPMYPAGVCVPNTASHRGRHGTLFDFWGGLTSSSQAQMYPNDGTRQFVQVGQMIMPWDGNPAPQTA